MTLIFRRLDHPLPVPRVIALCLAAALGLAASGGRVAAAAGKGNTKGFLITRSAQAFTYDAMEIDCPLGFELTTEEGFLATLTPAERERLLRPENAKEYGYRWREEYITGPGGENVCNNPKSFLTDPRHPAYRGVQSTVAYGLNLDGTTDGGATSNSCTHKKFEGLSGEAAVDNQLFRALGCSKSWRLQPDSGGRYFDSYLIEVRGLDDLRNDDHVEVGIYSTEDVSMRSQTGAHLPNQEPPRDAESPLADRDAGADRRWRADDRCHRRHVSAMADSPDRRVRTGVRVRVSRRSIPGVFATGWHRDRDLGGLSAYRQHCDALPLLQIGGHGREQRLRVGAQDVGGAGRRVPRSRHGAVHDDFVGPECGGDPGLSGSLATHSRSTCDLPRGRISCPYPTVLESKEPVHFDHEPAAAELSEAVRQERIGISIVRVDDEQLAAGAVLPAQPEVGAQ